MVIIRKSRKSVTWILCGKREEEVDPEWERKFKKPLGVCGYKILRDFFR